MRFAHSASIRNIGFGLLSLLLISPLISAERPEQPQRAAPAASSFRSSPRSVPMQASRPMVDRVNHGTIRHIDTQVIPQPVRTYQPSAPVRTNQPPAAPGRTYQPPTANEHVNAQQNVNSHIYVYEHQDAYVHHDVDVDVRHPQFWHSFAFGTRLAQLREGYVPVYVNGVPYYYDDGIYYQQGDNYYQEVYPPTGAEVPQLPDGATEIDTDNLTYFYAGGAFYVQGENGFDVVAPPLGVTVPDLPPGAVQVSINGGVAYQFDGVYYQPVFVNGVTQYITCSS